GRSNIEGTGGPTELASAFSGAFLHKAAPARQTVTQPLVRPVLAFACDDNRFLELKVVVADDVDRVLEPVAVGPRRNQHGWFAERVDLLHQVATGATEEQKAHRGHCVRVAPRCGA